jgi:translation initiation factor 4E
LLFFPGPPPAKKKKRAASRPLPLSPNRPQTPKPKPNSLYNNIKAPSQLQPSATYFLFREGIEPKWEDANNAGGGCWTANAPRGATNPRAVLDAWWLHAVLACIGEQFTEGHEICGVTVNIRQGGKDRIELWTRTAANEALTMSVGRDLKRLLDVPDSSKFGYVVFADKLQSGKARDRYSL